MMQRTLLPLLSLFFTLLALPSRGFAAYDLSVDYVVNNGSYSHIQGESQPVIDTSYRLVEDTDQLILCFKGVPQPVSVRLDLVDGGGTIHASQTLSYDRCLSTFEDEKQFDFPLYNKLTGLPLELPATTYTVKATVDSANSIPEDDEKNNSTSSASFNYTIYSGIVRFGAESTTTQSASIIRKKSTLLSPCLGSQYYISGGTGNWSTSWGNVGLTFDAGSICADGKVNKDGYSIDLIANAGLANAEDLTGQVAGLDVALNGVTLGVSGTSYTEARIALPDSISVHDIRTDLPKSTTGVNPHGETELIAAGASVTATDPADISLSINFAAERFFHGYGLPFYLGASGVKLDLGASDGITIISPRPFYVHFDTTSRLEEHDYRRQSGLPSNDAIFHTVDNAASPTITGNGLNCMLNLGRRTDLSGLYPSGLMTSFPRTSFPYGFINWSSSFPVNILDGQLDSLSSLTDLDYFAHFQGSCPEGNCGDPQSGTNFFINLPYAGITTDGGMGGMFKPLGKTTEWGLLRDPYHDSSHPDYAPLSTYTHDDSLSGGMLYIPGFIVPKSGSGQYTISQYLLGSEEFKDSLTPAVHHFLEDPHDTEATDGNHFFAGITIGPQGLVPLDISLGSYITDTPLAILFNGQNKQVNFALRNYSKYVLRSGGLTGVFNTGFSGDLEIYGYILHLSRFSFRQVLNQPDERSLIDGSLDLPFPAGITVPFSDLDLTCSGDFSGGTVEKEALCDGVDDDGDTVIDEGCYQALQYWNTPIGYLGMSFEDKGGNGVCPDPNNRALRLSTRNQVNGIDTSLVLHSFWNPDGSPEDDTITSLVETSLDTPDPLTGGEKNPGFSMQIRAGYLSYPENGNYSAPSPKTGFTNLVSSVDVPLFDALPIHGHLENGEVDEKGALAQDSYKLYLFNDESDNDGTNHDGVPTGYSDIASYREAGAVNDADNPPSPDPRPWARYSWPSSELINLDYPLTFNRADGTTPPQFLGVKQERNFFSASEPIIKVYSVPDYLKPLRTKLSFGVSADLAQLQNFHFNLGDLADLVDLDSWLGDTLGVNLNLSGSLSDLVTDSELMHSVTGGSITNLIELGLDEALATDPVDDAINKLVGVIDIAHSGPALISAQFESVLRNLKSELEALLSGALQSQLDNLIAPGSELTRFAAYNFDTLELAISDGLLPDPGNLPQLQAQLDQLRSGLAQLISLHQQVRTTLLRSQSTLQDVRSDINQALSDASGALTTLSSSLNGLGNYTSTDPATNPILGQISTARDRLRQVRNTIEALHLEDIATTLETAVAGLGGSIDTSLVRDAEQFIHDRLNELDQMLDNAESEYAGLVAGAGMSNLFTTVNGYLTNIQNHLDSLQAPLDSLFNLILVDTAGASTPGDGGYIAVALTILDQVTPFLEGINAIFDQTAGQIDTTIITTWTEVDQYGRDLLNSKAQALLTDLSTLSGTLGNVAQNMLATIDSTDPQTACTTLFNGLMTMLTAPLDGIIFQLSSHIEDLLAASMSFLPDPDAENIRELIKHAILNSPIVTELNNGFFAQFGFISDYIDDLITQITGQINELINGAIAALDEAINDQIAGITSKIGGAGGGLAAAKIDGYGIISQDEFERFHLEAEFTFAGEPDPTTYFAGLDITSWNAENGKGSGCTDAGDGLIDVSIFTRDISASMLGTSLGLKEALLGFTLQDIVPVGVFGYVYTMGELSFETLVLSDMGLEAGVGKLENYLGAKATGRFEDYTISAAFYFGKSCDYTILKRLDPEVAEFLGERSSLTGVYARGSAEVPILNYGCALKVGVGADIGAWYLADSPATYGGLLGGSAYGKVACLASLKGKVTLIGAKVGSQYHFSGSGWGAGGVGWCSPSKWTSVAKSRKDSWCATGDATYGATYTSGWSIDGPDISCCH